MGYLVVYRRLPYPRAIGRSYETMVLGAGASGTEDNVLGAESRNTTCLSLISD